LKRRDLLYNLASAGLILPRVNSFLMTALDGPHVARPRSAAPSPQQQAWQNLEFGMFVHMAPNTWQDLESDNLSTPLSQINPAELDTNQWAATAVAMGARYVVFVAKHQGGFCMWQTHTTDYGIRNTPWKDGKGDVLAEISASCRRHGLKLGVYVCPRDDHFGAGTGGICKTPALQAKYDLLYREQLTEVFSRYGEMVEIWFDGSTATPVGDLLKRYQPNAMVFQGPQATIRWVGNEDGFAPYPLWNEIDEKDAHTGTATALDDDPNGSAWLPNEVDVSIRRPDWFWHTNNENKVLRVDQLLSIYYRSVGRGAQLLLNIPANREGLLPQPDCHATADLGRELKRRFGTPIASTGGTGRSLMLKLPSPTRIDTVVMEEQIALGCRVRAYRLDGSIDGAWKPLGSGFSIGHKRIHPVEPVTVSAIRLVATEASATPVVRTFAVFDTQTAPPSDWNAVTSVWASNLIGTWSDGAFSLDLTKDVHVAAQYALRFHPGHGSVTGFKDVVLELGGMPSPGLVKISRTRHDEILLDITGLDKSIHIRGRVEGADAGSVLLERR